MGLSAQQLSQPLRLGHLRGDPRRLLRCLERPHGQIRGHRLNWNQRLGTGQDLGRLVLDDAFAEADGDVAALRRSALDVMADELPKPAVDRAAPGGLDPWRECFRIIQAREVWINYGGFIDRYQPKLGPGIRERMAVAARVSDRDVESARREQTRASERIRSLAQPGTILCLPTAPSISPLLATSEQDLESFHFHFGSLRLGANR